MITDKRIAILIVMMVLGTSWAIRGTFGHEFGAAWAGSIGVLAMILVSGRKDWYKNWPAIAAMGAIGWGVTGMISYGQVVGYGKSVDFLNASYGLFCLFVIGGLFGFLGGGLTGLILESSERRKIEWASLIAQMVAGAYIVWGYLIFQLEWFMTPPRSELWAACLGAALALGWYMKRNQFTNAWYVAFSTMLGAGFGFAFGNFIQTMGTVSGLSFNWWNAMEYSIGFFGGLGMAYGVFSRKWEEMNVLSGAAHNWSAAFLFIFVPLVTTASAFTAEDMLEMAGRFPSINVHLIQWLLILGISVTALIIIGIQLRKLTRSDTSRQQILIVFFTTWIWYKLLQVIESGILFKYQFSSYDLAFLNIIVVPFILWYWNADSPFSKFKNNQVFNNSLLRKGVSIVVLLIVLATIAVNSHGDLPGQQERFEFNKAQKD